MVEQQCSPQSNAKRDQLQS